jgi:hypothetical protein
MANVSCRKLRGSYPGGRSFKSRYVKVFNEFSILSRSLAVLARVHNTTTLSLQLDFREEERGAPGAHDRVILQFHKEISVAVAVKKGEPSH